MLSVFWPRCDPLGLMIVKSKGEALL